jgi:hypothetical protein
MRAWKAAVVFAGCAAALYRRIAVGDVLAARDVFRIFIPQSSFLLRALQHHALPLWLPNERLGQPFVGSLQSQVFYPLQLLPLLALGPLRVATFQQICHAVAAALGTFLVARALRTSTPGALLAGAAYGFSHLFTFLSWLPNVAGAAAWAPWIVLGALRAGRRPPARGLAGVALPAALALLAGSPEALLWEGPLALLAALSTRRTATRAGLLTVGGLALGVLLASVALLPALELARLSTRAAGLSHPLEWSASWAQVLALFWPHADEPRGPYLNGPDQWLLASLFVGTLCCALALLALRRSRRVAPFAAAAALLLLLSLGEHFPPTALLLRLPPFDFFRYPVKYLVGAAFCIALLAGSGLDRAAALARRHAPGLKLSGTLVAGLAFAVGLATVATRVGPLRANAGQGVLWLGLWGAVGCSLFAALPGPRRGKRVRSALLGAFAVEGLMSLWVFGTPAWTPAIALERPSLLASSVPVDFGGRISVATARGSGEPDAAPYSLAAARDALEPLTWMEDGLSALEGYGPPAPRYSALFEQCGRGAFDLAGVAYYVRNDEAPFPDAELVAAPPGLPRLYRTRTAFPRAFVARRSVVVGDRAAAEALDDEHAPARHTAFLASGESLESECAGSVTRISEGIDEAEIDATACAPSYLVVADAYFPGWDAEVDGRPSAIERADLAMRAVKLTPGSHTVRMRYLPRSFRWGAATSALALAALGLALLREHRKSNGGGTLAAPDGTASALRD